MMNVIASVVTKAGFVSKAAVVAASMAAAPGAHAVQATGQTGSQIRTYAPAHVTRVVGHVWPEANTASNGQAHVTRVVGHVWPEANTASDGQAHVTRVVGHVWPEANTAHSVTISL